MTAPPTTAASTFGTTRVGEARTRWANAVMNTTANATSKHKIVVTTAPSPIIFDAGVKVQCYMLQDAAAPQSGRLLRLLFILEDEPPCPSGRAHGPLLLIAVLHCFGGWHYHVVCTDGARPAASGVP
jgi:hypothetical protein